MIRLAPGGEGAPRGAADAPPLVVSVAMGYGHLRAAHAVARALGAEVLHADAPPLASDEEARLWKHTRLAYEATSRLSQLPWVGGPLRSALEALTDIPRLHPLRDLSGRTAAVRAVERLLHRGVGRGLVDALHASGAPLVTTFYVPAIAADRAGCRRVHCVVTDADVNRVWATAEPAKGRIRYLAPSRRVARRLVAYGVPPERITFTGFPLPDELVGGASLETLSRNLAARLVRLDPEREFRRAYRDELARFLGPLPGELQGSPPLVVFAVGGAGAQAELARVFLPRLRSAVLGGRMRLALVAGTRREVADGFRRELDRARFGAAAANAVEVLEASTFAEYYDRFNALLARADVLWTKPSELTFYAALGLPLVFAWPVGTHERYNRRFAVEAGAGLRQGDPRYAADWLAEWLADGTLAGAAWSGFMRLPKHGLYRIVEAVTG
ncbi:MAG: DUF6938 domain-containing protein [Anaeromyxobacteraceae bacterium]